MIAAAPAQSFHPQKSAPEGVQGIPGSGLGSSTQTGFAKWCMVTRALMTWASPH